MGILERKQRQMQEVRTTILEQAWQIVQQEGWQALSIRKIADAIEYSTPFIYRHFENKDAIIEAFTKEGYQLLAENLQAAQNRHTDPLHQLMAIAEAYWDFAFSNEKHYQIMFGLGIPACGTARDITEMKKVGDVILSSMGVAIAKGKNPDADKYFKFRTFWSILHGLIAIEFISGNNNAGTARLTLNDAVEGFIKALIT